MERLSGSFFYSMEEEGPKAVLDWCFRKGLISPYYVCPTCGHQMILSETKKGKDGYQWSCRKNSHRVLRCVRKGSWLGECRLPITDILLLTYFWINNLSSTFIEEELKVRKKLVRFWRHLCRETCIELCVNESVSIGGENEIVELEELRFGKRLCHNGNRVSGNWVYAGVERSSKSFFFKVVEDRSAETILDVIKTSILPGTTIISPIWRTHKLLGDGEFLRLSIARSLVFECGSTDETWGAIKRKLPNKHVDGHFDSYLAHFMWHRMHTDPPLAMQSFLENVKSIYTPCSND